MWGMCKQLPKQQEVSLLIRCGGHTCMWIKDTWEESMACRAKPVLLQSKLASCMAGMHIVRDVTTHPSTLVVPF